MENIIYLGVQFGFAVVFFLAGRYVLPNVTPAVVDKLALLSGWAAKFVAWAKEFKQDKTGQEKMAAVVAELAKIAEKAGIEVTQEQLEAIAQTAYNAMKAGELEEQ